MKKKNKGAYEAYAEKIRTKAYKNAKAVIGPINRLAREKRIKPHERVALITLARSVYGKPGKNSLPGPLEEVRQNILGRKYKNRASAKATVNKVGREDHRHPADLAKLVEAVDQVYPPPKKRKRRGNNKTLTVSRKGMHVRLTPRRNGYTIEVWI